MNMPIQLELLIKNNPALPIYCKVIGKSNLDSENMKCYIKNKTCNMPKCIYIEYGQRVDFAKDDYVRKT